MQRFLLTMIHLRFNPENETLTHERFLDAIVENQFKCDKCSKTFDDGNSLQKHLSQHPNTFKGHFLSATDVARNLAKYEFTDSH